MSIDLQDMSADELKIYETAAKNTSRFLNITGISIIFGMLVFNNLVTLIVGGVLVFIISKIGVGVDITLKMTRELLSKPTASEDK